MNLHTLAPHNSATTAASSATDRSAVPAQRTVTVPVWWFRARLVNEVGRASRRCCKDGVRLLTDVGVLVVVVRVSGVFPQDEEAGRGQVLEVAERLFV